MTNECVFWSGSVNAYGYGTLQNPNRLEGEPKQLLAHRWAWQQANGPIPPGMYICHSCDEPRCVNPAHLFLGTPSDNTRDAIAKGRFVVKTPQEMCKRGHPIETIGAYRRCRTCHREYMRRRRAA